MWGPLTFHCRHEHLDRAVRVTRETRAVHYEHGKLNLLLKNYQEARIEGERALALPDPSGVILDLQVFYLLTTVFQRLGEEERWIKATLTLN